MKSKGGIMLETRQSDLSHKRTGNTTGPSEIYAPSW